MHWLSTQMNLAQRAAPISGHRCLISCSGFVRRRSTDDELSTLGRHGMPGRDTINIRS
jgi:hypothetical protein